MTQELKVGVVGGSGLYDLDGLSDLDQVTLSTPFGAPSDAYLCGTLGETEVVFLPRHGVGHRISPTEINSRANIWGLKQLGVTHVLSVSAVGSLREEIVPGHFVVVDQFIDRTRHRPDTFFGEGVVAHVMFADPVCPVMRSKLVESANSLGITVHDGGTYLNMEGPQFSTRAESLIWRELGCDVIGMTALTEARLAREAELAYASLNLVTDYDAWRPEERGVDAAEIMAVLNDNAHVGKEVLRQAVSYIPERRLPENDVLKNALITPLELVPLATKEKLAAILAPYLLS